MAYDQKLATRIRSLLADEPGVTEKKMFGGLAFLVNGNMAVAASGQGGMMLRYDPHRSEDLVDHDIVTPMVMKGRPMTGWLLVDTEKVNDESLGGYVGLGVDYCRGLPVK